jgi:drug/metabolite transporter (DMT)-like permease
MKKPSSKALIILAFFAIYVIWGSTYLLNKISVTELPPLFLAAIRFSIAGILIFVIAKVLKYKIKITKKQLLISIIIGFLFLVYGNGDFVWALKYVDSGFGALLAYSQPLFVLILMRIMDNKKMNPKSLVGVGLGILGMYLLVSHKELVTNQETILGVIMIFTCVLSWSYGSVFVSKADVPKNYLVSSGYQMITASIMLGIASLILGETWISPLVWSPKVQLSMLALITFGSIAAFTAFNYLLKQVSTEKVTTSAYVNPIVAMILGWYVLDETLSTQSIIAALIILTGVYFIITRERNSLR